MITNANTTNQIRFTSRNKVIRQADDIVRIVNKEYPRLSSTNFEKFEHIDQFENVLERVNQKVGKLRRLTQFWVSMGKTPIEKMQNMTFLISDLKSGNCMESRNLCAIAAKVNGLKNITSANLHNDTDDKEIDHTVLLINDDPPYIMDAWLGFADYVPNAVQRYKNEFSDYFEINNEDKISIKPSKNSLETIMNECLKFVLRGCYYNLLLPNNKKKDILAKIMYLIIPCSLSSNRK